MEQKLKIPACLTALYFDSRSAGYHRPLRVLFTCGNRRDPVVPGQGEQTMALQDIAERLEGAGWLGIGIGAVILAPVLIPPLGRKVRPAIKGAIKGYIALSEKAAAALAEAGEQFQDLVAEAKAEHAAGGASMMEMPAGDDALVLSNGEGVDDAAEPEAGRRS